MERPTRETLTVEFKSDRGPLRLEELYKALVAMANTDGGVLCLGVEDSGDVSGVNEQHKNLTEMAAKIQTHTVPSLVPTLHLETWDRHDVLVLEVKQSRQLTMTSDGQYLRRRLKSDGSPENIPMQPHEIMQRLSSIRAIDPSAQMIETLTAREALNPLERDRLRGMVQTYRGEASLLELSDEELDKALDLVRELDGVCYPTVAGLLLMGHERYIREFVPGNEVLFQVLDGVNVLVNPTAMRESLLQIFEKVSLLFQSRVVEQEIQVGLFRVPVPNYEREAFREGFVNALVHRDYFVSGAVHIQLQNRAMVISSPGGFPDGVRADNILSVAPTPRNRTLAEAVKRIGLAERTGRGVDKIYSAMLRSGHEIPDYSDSSAASVILRLNSASFDEKFVRMLVAEEQRMDKMMSVDALIVLATLRHERRATLDELSHQIQKGESDARNTVERLVELGVVEGVGNGRARRYMLSSKVYALSGNEAGYTRQRGMTTIQEKDIILRHLEKFQRITRADVVDLCRCDRNHASYLLRRLLQDGTIKKIGSGKSAYYTQR